MSGSPPAQGGEPRLHGEWEERYTAERKSHWDQVARAGLPDGLPRRSYHRLLTRHYGLIIPPGSKILELGCGTGDLLASLQPSRGLGVDFSGEMTALARSNHPDLEFVEGDVHTIALDEKFDFIILSDLVNDLWDIQRVLRHLRRWIHPGSRVVINFWSRLWQPVLGLARMTGQGAPLLEQNWVTFEDMANMLALEDLEVVKKSAEILLPLELPALDSLANGYLVKLPVMRLFAMTNVITARPLGLDLGGEKTVTVVVPARNERGNIDDILRRVPEMGAGTEIIFVEGGSTDNTYETIEKAIPLYPDKKIKLLKQTGKGKGDAVRAGFAAASGELLMILDADLTVPPEDLPLFYEALATGKCEFANGVRLVYPMEKKAMRFFNLLGNKGFSMIFSWLLGQNVKDTLCGTKALHRDWYQRIAAGRSYFGEFDPFGDFDLLLGAVKQNMKVMDLPIRYRERTYGETNIQRWKHGLMLARMVLFAARRIKFV